MKHLILAGSMFFLIATTAVAGDWRQDAVNQDEDFSTIWAEDSVTTASVTEVSEFSALEGIEQSIHWRERALDYDEDFSSIWTTL